MNLKPSFLQRYALGEADRLVSFLSRTMGRMRGVAAGARKPKSRFGSTLERLSHIRIWFFERETRELVRISQCEMIESFLDAFRDYPSSVALALFSEITEAVLPDREPSDANFRLLLLAAQAVKRTAQARSAAGLFRAVDSETGRLASIADAMCALRRRIWTQMPQDTLCQAVPQLCAESAESLGCGCFHRQPLALRRRMLEERLDRLDRRIRRAQSARAPGN